MHFLSQRDTGKLCDTRPSVYCVPALRRTTAIATITAYHSSSHDKLVALITGWIQDDPTASWKELVDAVEMCPLKVIAEKIATDVLT